MLIKILYKNKYNLDQLVRNEVYKLLVNILKSKSVDDIDLNSDEYFKVQEGGFAL